jgi:tRNA A-37 threonylcarbamoyl transferase component Bud32/streptogramin lyase
LGLRANTTLSADTPDVSDVDLLGYRVEELVGHGGMGVVYLAFDLRLKRRVALKLMTPDLAVDERFRERFARESELVMSLEHPNVVPIHDAGELDGQLYLAMRYVEGTDLRALLRSEGALAPTRAVSIVRQVAHALDAAHARGLVHRDVKPSNVLLDESEHVYLADFGLTRRVTDDGARLGDARSLGTPAYLAPEQIEGRPVDGRSDVYSLGCLLYECLTGEPPFVGPSRLAVAWAHLEEEPPSISARNRRLPQALDAVIQKAMAKEPEERYATCGELVAAAEAALGIDRPRRRRALLAVAAAAVAIAAVAIAAFAVTAISSPTDEATGASPPPDPERLVRIDPATNRVSAEIDVGAAPTATAVSGRTVWVYNRLDRTVSEVAAATNEVRHTTEVSTEPAVLAYGTGPVLAADAAGAWLVGYDARRDRHLLTRVPAGGGAVKEYRLGMDLAAVVVADGAVWVLAHRGRRNAALRIDPVRGRVLASLRLPNDLLASRVDGLAVGNGYVWVTNLNTARLYRVDPETGDMLERDFGSYATRPALGYGWLWMCIARTTDPAMGRVDPRTLRNTLESGALPAEEGQYAVGYGSVWRHDVPSGTLMRFDPRTAELTGLVRLMPAGGDAAHLYVTSIAAGAGAVWVTLSQS